MTQLSPSAQKVQDALNALGFDLTVIENAESARTAQEAADRVGVTLGQIVKSLIFKGKNSGKPILVLTSGSNRADEKRIKAYAGEKIGRADADFVRAVTGYAIGGVPPIAHLQKMEADPYLEMLIEPEIFVQVGSMRQTLPAPAFEGFVPPYERLDHRHPVNRLEVENCIETLTIAHGDYYNAGNT